MRRAFGYLTLAAVLWTAWLAMGAAGVSLAPGTPEMPLAAATATCRSTFGQAAQLLSGELGRRCAWVAAFGHVRSAVSVAGMVCAAAAVLLAMWAARPRPPRSCGCAYGRCDAGAGCRAGERPRGELWS